MTEEWLWWCWVQDEKGKAAAVGGCPLWWCKEMWSRQWERPDWLLFWWLNTWFTEEMKSVWSNRTVGWQLHQKNKTHCSGTWFYDQCLWDLKCLGYELDKCDIIRTLDLGSRIHLSPPPLLEVSNLLCPCPVCVILFHSPVFLFALRLIGSARRATINEKESHLHWKDVETLCCFSCD